MLSYSCVCCYYSFVSCTLNKVYFRAYKNQNIKKTENLVLWELERNQNTLTEVKVEHTLKFGITKPTKRSH